MAPIQFNIPKELVDDAAQAKIAELTKEVKSLQTKLKRREEKIAEMEEKDRTGERAVEAIKSFLEQIRYDYDYVEYFDTRW